MKKANQLVFMGGDIEYKDADIVIFGAPYDGTTSNRPGTRFGPDAVRNESYGLEEYSPYFDMEYTEKLFIDTGDIDFENSLADKTKVLEQIEAETKSILDDNKKPFMIGGEHLVTYPQVKALKEKYNDLYIIHLDAHADLRQVYGGSEFSHATVIKRCHDLVGKDRIFQFGIRSGTKEEFEFSKDNTYMEKFSLDTIKDILPKLEGKDVYLTIDLDVLDPSIFPGTGTPEPGGVTFKELLTFIQEIKDLNFVGMDVVELSPHYDATGTSNAVASKVVRELLCIL